jgi:cell division inhibitor SepF
VASVWQKSLMYLGLVDEEQLDDEVHPPRHIAPTDRRNEPAATDQQSEQGLPGRRVEPPSSSAHRLSESNGPLRSNPAVRPVARTQSRCDVVEVFEFDDAKLLADRIRDRTPVLLNLRETDPEMVRRVIDFSTGLTYALDGSMRKIADGVILVLPPRVSLGREEELRLSELGLFDVE